jgi:hypothetical protein
MALTEEFASTAHRRIRQLEAKVWELEEENASLKNQVVEHSVRQDSSPLKHPTVPLGLSPLPPAGAASTVAAPESSPVKQLSFSPEREKPKSAVTPDDSDSKVVPAQPLKPAPIETPVAPQVRTRLALGFCARSHTSLCR